MTDNEIKKALECCATDTCFTNSCPFEDESDGFDISKCTSSLSRIALDLINRQQAEIERLKKLLAEEEAKYDKCAKRFYKEGIKEFVERLCKDRVSNDPVVIAVKVELKEMVGDAE